MESLENTLENGKEEIDKSNTNKRELEFKGKKGEYLCAIAKHLLKYFEDADIEDFQISDFKKATLIKRGDIKEFVDDENLTKEYIKVLMYFVASIAPKKLNNTDSQVSLMLPVNKFRFTGRIGNSVGSGILISIRLNDNKIYHTYKDFGLRELEFNFLVKYISKEGLSTFVIGGTGSGKTTFNNLLIQHISENDLMIVIGDIHDYIFHGDQKVREVFAKNNSEYASTFDLAMRSDPDRVLVSELTMSNANLILRSINDGHEGFMLTMHSSKESNSVAEAFAKNLEMSGIQGVSVSSINDTINSHIDFLIYLKNHKGKRLVDKVVINNKEAQKEAQELGIFGFKKEKEKINKKNKSSKQLSTKAVSKLIEDLAKGMNKTKIAKKHEISRGTVISLSKKLKTVIK